MYPWRSMTVDDSAADPRVSWDPFVHKTETCWPGTLYRSPPAQTETSVHYFFLGGGGEYILSKDPCYWQPEFENPNGRPERGLRTVQGFPERAEYRDSQTHLISARISTPASFPVVCGLENTNVHVSWAELQRKSPLPRGRAACFWCPWNWSLYSNIIWRSPQWAAGKHIVFFHLWCHITDKTMIWDHHSEPWHRPIKSPRRSLLVQRTTISQG